MISLLSFAGNDTRTIILWVVLVAAALGLIAMLIHTILTSRKAKKNGANNAQYNVDEQAVQQEQEFIEANGQGQLVMPRNVIYSAGLEGQIRVGKYTLTSADESVSKFNVRFNGLVKEYANGDVLTLTDGDTISSVSGSVVLTPVED